MSGVRWTVPPHTAWGDLSDAYVAAIRAGVTQIANRWAPQIATWMKQNAPWTDQTGNARQTLHTEVNAATQDMVEIIMAHGVEYGLWLEVRHAGAYAIINPALDHFAPRIWSDIVRMLQ